MLKYAEHHITFETNNFEYTIVYSYYINGTGYTYGIESKNQDWYKHYIESNEKPHFYIIEKDASYVLKPIEDKFFDYNIITANLEIEKISINKCEEKDFGSGIFEEHINILQDGQILLADEIRYIDIVELRRKKIDRLKKL